MGLISTVEIIKRELYSESVVLLKVGTFYHSYFKDAEIISYLFGYKIKKMDNDTNDCGFPVSSLANVRYILEQKKISYIVIDRAHNYEEDEKEDFGKENTYIRCYEKASRTIALKSRIENISRFLLSKVDSEDINNILLKMENIVNEKR